MFVTLFVNKITGKCDLSYETFSISNGSQITLIDRPIGPNQA